jgi:hypothetical protein
VPTDATMVALHSAPSLILGMSSKIDVCNMQGIVKHSLYFSEDSDGALVHMGVANDYLVVVSKLCGVLPACSSVEFKVTGRNQLKVYDIGKKEAKLHCSKKVNESVLLLISLISILTLLSYLKIGQIAWVACNCNGTFVTFIANSVSQGKLRSQLTSTIAET